MSTRSFGGRATAWLVRAVAGGARVRAAARRACVHTGLALALHAGCAALAGCATSGSTAALDALPTPTALVAEGAQAERLGDSLRAEQYYASAVAAGAPQAELTGALVRVCLRGGRLRSALGYAEAELAVHPDDGALGQLLGGLHLALGELGAAEAVLRAVLRQHDDAPLAHYTLALALSRDPARAAEARGHFRRYLELAPHGPHSARARHALVPALLAGRSPPR